MRKHTFYMLMAALCCGACSQKNDAEQMLDDKLQPQTIEAQRQAISQREIEIGTPNLNHDLGQAKARELVTLYQSYVSVNPHDSLSAGYLFKAAGLSVGLGNHEAAVNLLDRLIRDFPAFDKAPEAMLFKGFVCEVHLNNHARAVQAYEALVKRYPNHRLANDAQAAIENLTLSEEELLAKLKAGKGT